MSDNKNSAAKIVLLVLTVLAVISMIFGTMHHFGAFDFLRSGSAFAGSGSREMIEKSESFDDVTELLLDLDISNISISEGDGFTVTYEGEERFLPKTELKDGKLKVVQSNRNISFKASLTDLSLARDFKLSVTVPRGTVIKNGDIDLDFGNINIKDVAFEKLTIDADMGNIEGDNVSCDRVSIDADMGNVDFDDFSFTDLDVSADMGNIDIKSADDISGYSVDLSCSMGSVKYMGEKYGTNLKRSGKNGSIAIDADMGNIDIK